MTRGVLRQTSHPAVAVFDAPGCHGTLAFTRSLGRARVRAHVFSSGHLPAARLSRYCTAFARCPPLERADLFLPWLDKLSRGGTISLVAPTSDLLALYMVAFPEVFPAQQRYGVGHRDAVLQVLLQDRCKDLCAKRQLRTPWAIFPNSREEALDGGASLPYPVVLKPRSGLGLRMQRRAAVVRNELDLQQVYAPYPTPVGCEELLRLLPGLRWPMIEEYIPGGPRHAYRISGLLAPGGRMVASACTHCEQMWPPGRHGAGRYGSERLEAWGDVDIIGKGLRLVTEVLHRGLFEMVFVYDERVADYIVVGVHPRCGRHVAFDVARNNDLPHWWYRGTLGESIPEHEGTRNDIRGGQTWRHHRESWRTILRGPSRLDKLSAYVGGMRSRTHVDGLHELSDPLPSISPQCRHRSDAHLVFLDNPFDG